MAWFDIAGAACAVCLIGVAGVEYAFQTGDYPSERGRGIAARAIASTVCQAPIRRTAIKEAVIYSFTHPVGIPPWRLPRLIAAKVDKPTSDNILAREIVTAVACSI